MKTVQDFNYKVALASGLKHLQGGRLRQAEEQFRYLVSKFPGADGGHRGLARVYVELGDKPAALSTLRDGAAVLSRGGDRALAIDLLREATLLDPLDLVAHRRLAAALALTGDEEASAQEYVRFAEAEVAAGDPERARLETAYALETLVDVPAIIDLAGSLGVTRPVRPTPPEPEVSEPMTLGAPWTSSAEVGVEEEAAAAPVVAEPAAAPGAAEAVAVALPAHVAPAAEQDPLELEARAARLLAAGDAGAGKAAIAAASALLAARKVQAASDLLLQLVVSGIEVHDAQRELIAVAHALGRQDLAAERAALLAQALRQAGDEERAAEVERMGSAPGLG